MLIARQNGHIDHVPWMKKPADLVKGKKREKTAEKERLLDPNPLHCTSQTHTHAHTLILFNESREEHKGITSINAKSIEHNSGHMQKVGVLVGLYLCTCEIYGCCVCMWHGSATCERSSDIERDRKRASIYVANMCLAKDQ